MVYLFLWNTISGLENFFPRLVATAHLLSSIHSYIWECTMIRFVTCDIFRANTSSIPRVHVTVLNSLMFFFEMLEIVTLTEWMTIPQWNLPLISTTHMVNRQQSLYKNSSISPSINLSIKHKRTNNNPTTNNKRKEKTKQWKVTYNDDAN